MPAIAPAPPTVASLMYHEVVDDPTTSGFQRPSARPYTYSRAEFAGHLDAIAAGPRPPALVDRITLVPSLGGAGRHLLLTFDDGGRSAMYAAEELSRRGWLGHFFIVTGRIGEATFLKPTDIKELRQAGHIIGTHSHTHPDIFRDLTRDQMLAEWRVSADILSALLGEPCVAASVPGGDISLAVLESADAAGLTYLFTSEPWLHARRIGRCWVLGRLSLKAGVPPARVRELVAFRGWRRAQVERQLKELARRSLGPLYRRYVRHITGGGDGTR